MMKKKKQPNIRRRGEKWYFRYNITDPNTGRRIQKEIGFKTEKEAIKASVLIKSQLIEGTYVEEKSISFKDFSADWLESYSKTGLAGRPPKPGTTRIRTGEVYKLNNYFAASKLKTINLKMYQDAIIDLKEKGYSTSTLCGIHGTGRMIFRNAIKLGFIKKDPTEFAVIPKDIETVESIEAEEKQLKYMEKEYLKIFLNTAKEHGLDRDYVIFLSLAYTGMRVGELSALKWTDIDFKESTINISKTLYNPTNNIRKYQLVTPKTKKSRRTIIVDSIVINELKKHKALQNEYLLVYGENYYLKNGFVFAQMDANNPGYPMYIKLIDNRMKRLLKIIQMDNKLTPHSLRHTHTSLLAEAGVSLEQIMHRLGHSDDDITKQIYLHITKPKQIEASHKFAELMKSL